MTTIIDTIMKANYAATDTQVEQLAHTLVLGETADNVYLRVLLNRMQAQLGRPRRGKAPPQEPVLEAIHEKLYAVALRGVGPEDMPMPERHRKANRFRTNAATVRYFIQHGGDVRSLDIATVSKASLRKSVQPGSAPVEGETRAQKAFRAAEAAVLRTLERLVKASPDEARGRVEHLMDELEAWLAKLDAGQPAAPDHSASTTIVGARSPGRPSAQPAQLHRGA